MFGCVFLLKFMSAYHLIYNNYLFQIAADMATQGFSVVTGRMCDVKFKNLKTTYKTIKMRQQQSLEVVKRSVGPIFNKCTNFYKKMLQLIRAIL